MNSFAKAALDQIDSVNRLTSASGVVPKGFHESMQREMAKAQVYATLAVADAITKLALAKDTG